VFCNVRHSSCVYNELKVQLFKQSTTSFGCKILVFLQQQLQKVWKNMFAPWNKRKILNQTSRRHIPQKINF